MVIASAIVVVSMVLVGTAASLSLDLGATETVALVQGTATLIAIAVGGVFAYHKLDIFREFQPHLTITQTASHRRVGDDYVHIWVHVSLANTSKVAIEIRDASFWAQQISPLSNEEIEALYEQFLVQPTGDKLIQFPRLEEYDREWGPEEFVVEPGETETERYQFIIGKDVTTISLSAFFVDSEPRPNSRSERGWSAVNVYDIN